MKYLVTGRSFLSEVEMSCHRKKFPVTERNFLSQKETSCHKNKFPATVKNFLSQEKITQITVFLDIFCHVWLPVFRYWLPRRKIFYPTLAFANICYFLPFFSLLGNIWYNHLALENICNYLLILVYHCWPLLTLLKCGMSMAKF